MFIGFGFAVKQASSFTLPSKAVQHARISSFTFGTATSFRGAR
ncbi:hypothetical protein RHOER0001_2784 [Rhodococcus erythropolis SK121]|nr:hypothetical protein RHOER0001_2784 [Rhodococcus erythropolis SK121]